MPQIFLVITSLLTFALLANPHTLRAHHSPSEVVQALTTRIDSGERTPKLLTRRADEYRALGHPKQAIADYHSALKSNNNYLPAVYGLAKAHFAQKEYQLVQQTTRQGIQIATNPNQAASFHALAAQAHEKLGHPEIALAAWDQALKSTNPEIDWYLSKASLLQQSASPEQAHQFLERAQQQNPSTVLHRAWLEALITSGDTRTPAPHIAAGIQRSRWKSSWLLLRAKLHLADQNSTAAHQDAQAALNEINSRLNPNTKNPFLIAAQRQSQDIIAQTQ